MNKAQAMQQAAKRKAANPELIDGYEDEFWVEDEPGPWVKVGSLYAFDVAVFKVTAVNGKLIRLTRSPESLV